MFSKHVLIFCHVLFLDISKEQDDTTRQLLAHVPNSLIYFDHKKNMPATKEFLGVVLFADISGKSYNFYYWKLFPER